MVDDDPAIRHLLGSVLSSEGFLVRSANDGVQALVAIEEAEPDLVILDLQMPVLDGRAVLAELRRQERPLAVLIVTALEARAVGREFGIPALEKPFDVTCSPVPLSASPRIWPGLSSRGQPSNGPLRRPCGARWK